MEKAKKLLNLLMGNGASDGEIINSRNALKKICEQNNIKITLGNNSNTNNTNNNKSSEKYDTLYELYKYQKEKRYILESENAVLNSKIKTYNEQLNIVYTQIEKHKTKLKNKEKDIIELNTKCHSLKMYLKIMSSIIIIMFITFIFAFKNKENINTVVVHKFSTFSKNKQDYFYLIMDYQGKEQIQYKDYEKYVQSFEYVKNNNDISKTLKQEYDIDKDKFNIIYDDDYYRNNTLLKYKGE